MAAEIICRCHFAAPCSFLMTDTDYPVSGLAVENVAFDTFSQPHSCNLRKAHEKCITMVTPPSSFFLKKKCSSEEKRPDGEDIPRQLRHDIWCDPNWHSALPETGYTCGSGEADGLYIHGTTSLLPFLFRAAQRAARLILCVEAVITGSSYNKRRL